MLNKTFIQLCKEKLLTRKSELLNRYHSHFKDFRERERGGDETDQSVSLLEEYQLFASHIRLRQQLLEIEQALNRIDRGTYGICEETEEPIEKDRLLAVPWTRLSIEGAEIRDAKPPKRRA